MVKPEFENLEIDFWVYPGKLGVTQPSLCLFHDAVENGAPLLDALTELKGTTCPSQRMLTFRTCSRKLALCKLKLMLVPDRENLKVMNIHCDADAAAIEMTQCGLQLIIDAVASWLAGAEDFGVSPRHASIMPKQFGRLDNESGELWFWGPRYNAP